jgi:hypothetical protein
MASHLRDGLVAKIPAVILDGEVEADEVYVVAGHKGNPAAVQKKAAPGDADGSRGRAAEARWKRKNRRSWGEAGPRFRQAQLGGMARRG